MADRRVSVNLDADVSAFVRGMLTASAASKGLGTALKSNEPILTRQDKLIDRASGRLRLLSEAALTLGPAFVPLGAAAVPALAGLTVGLTAAAAAAGVALMAFNGMGDALKALDTYQLEPTTKNLEKMQDALANLGPAGADFARFLDSLDPTMRDLQNIAREGLFPGLQEGIEKLLPMLPQIERILGNVSTALGDIGADAGAALAGGQFSAFFDYLETDAAPTLEAFAHATGNVAQGLGSLMVAFGPLSRDFSTGLERATDSFAEWAAGLSQTDGFRDFVEYVRESGPQAAEFLGALSTALVGVIKAAAPFGQAVLPALTALAKVITVIANSPIGPPLFTAAAALLAFNRAAILTSATLTRLTASTTAAAGGLTRMQKAAGLASLALGGLLVIDSLQQSADKAAPSVNELGNALLTLSGDGALPEDLDNLAAGIARLADPNTAQGIQDTLSGLLGGIGNDSLHDNAVKQIEALDQALTNIVNNQGTAAAATALDNLRRSAGLSEQDFKALVSLLPGYEDAVAGAAGATDSYAASTENAGRAARYTRAEIRGLVSAMEEQRTEALSAFDAVTQYAQALDAAREQAKKSSAGINAATKAGRENREALSALAAAWNNQSDAVRNNVDKWREARRNFVQSATDMGVPIKKARELADALMEIPRSKVVEVNVKAGQAFDAVSSLNYALSQLRDKTVNVSLMYKRAGVDVATGSADGGSVPKGGDYRDKHLYLLAPGEEIISNRHGQADQFRADRAAGMIPGYASGGTTGKKGSSRPAHMSVVDLNDAGAVTHIVDLRAQLRDLNAQIERSTQAVENETIERDLAADSVRENQAEVDRLTGLYAALASTVQAGLAANQFATIEGSDDPWSAGARPDRAPTLPEILAALDTSTANANSMTAATATLSANGLSGAALQSVLGQGLSTAQMFASLTPEQLAQYQSTFDTNAAAVAAAGAAAGDAVFGSEMAAANQILAESRAELAVQTGELRTQTLHLQAAERQRDEVTKQLGKVKDALDDIREEIKQARGAAASGARSRR